MTAQQDEMPSEPRSDIERVLCTGDEICQHCDVIYSYITDIGIYAVRMKQRAESAESRLAALRHWLQNNMTFYDTDKSDRPVLAAISKRIWYHATNNQTDYPFDALADAPLKSNQTKENV